MTEPPGPSAARAVSRSTAEHPSTLPPVGLAGLLSWWDRQYEVHPPAARSLQTEADPPFELIAPGMTNGWGWAGRDTEKHHPADQRPAVAVGAMFGSDPLDTFRDALEQVLLDEALAEGLEVFDGPA